MNKLLVFGCGKKAEEISRYIDKKRNKILFYIDNDAKKVWGGGILRKRLFYQMTCWVLRMTIFLIEVFTGKKSGKHCLESAVKQKKTNVPWAR